MKRLFLDTSYLLALIRKRDFLHEKALLASQQYSGPFITTDLVLIELANSLSAPPTRNVAVKVIERIRADNRTMVVAISSTLLADAFELYKQRQDKAWGMIDCFSFVVMQARGCTVALTFDEHFRQAGFKTPLFVD